ncbi:MAG: AI-2E family transporter [Pseudorhodoplanes sp.]
MSARTKPSKSTDWPQRHAGLGLTDPTPVADTAAFWRVTSQVATISMAVILFGFFLYFTRTLMLPVLSALVVSLTIGPLAERAARRGVPTWISAIGVVLAIAAAVYLAIVMLSQPVSELIARSPDIGTAIKEKLQLLDRPLAALHELRSAMPGQESSVTLGMDPSNFIAGALSLITPALAQILLFFATLFFFLIGHSALRRAIVNLFDARENRLRALKIVTDIEQNLSAYLITVTLINLGVGLVTMTAAYVMGLPTPILWGALAFVLNYLPYVGPGIMYVVLFVIGLLVYPTLWSALIPPAFQMALSFLEGQLLTPNIIGRRLLMQPLAVFLSFVFWAWMWGPIGAFLATPILIMATVAINHLYPTEKTDLPG